MSKITRREFMTSMGMTITAGGLAGLSIKEAMAQPIEKLAENVPTKMLGNTGFRTKIIGLGAMIYAYKKISVPESDKLLNAMLDMGINYYETARVYKNSEEMLGRVLPKRRDEIFISSKTIKKSKKGALQDIEVSLANLKTDYIDMYMLHDISSLMEYEKAMGKDGALEGIKQAQKEGKIRFIGLTGHSVQAHRAAIATGEFEVLLMPYNIVARENERVMNLAAEKNIAVMIMKPMAFGGLLKCNADDSAQIQEKFSPEECLRFVLSHPGVTLAIPGMNTIDILKENLAIAASFKPLTEGEQNALIAKAERLAGGICGLCRDKPCDKACPQDVPVSFLVSNRQYANRFVYDTRRQGDLYAVMQRSYFDCDNCGECEKVCPKNLETGKEVKRGHVQIYERRARYMKLEG